MSGFILNSWLFSHTARTLTLPAPLPAASRSSRSTSAATEPSRRPSRSRTDPPSRTRCRDCTSTSCIRSNGTSGIILEEGKDNVETKCLRVVNDFLDLGDAVPYYTWNKLFMTFPTSCGRSAMILATLVCILGNFLRESAFISRKASESLKD